MILEIIILVVVVFASIMMYRGFKGLAYVIYLGLLRHAMVSNFSRFGQDWDEMRIVVMDDVRGYFVRDNALWMVEVHDDDLVKSTARPVDLITVDADKLKEAMTAVELLHSDISDQFEEDDD